MNHTIKGFGIVNKAEIDVFLECSCFFDDSVDAGNLMYGSSAFSKTSLNIWRFTVQVLLKPHLENFKHHYNFILGHISGEDMIQKDTRTPVFRATDHHFQIITRAAIHKWFKKLLSFGEIITTYSSQWCQVFRFSSCPRSGSSYRRSIQQGIWIISRFIFWNSFAFSMIYQMLAIWSLDPLPFLKPAWTSGSSQSTYCWSLAWRILSITLLAHEMSAIVR